MPIFAHFRHVCSIRKHLGTLHGGQELRVGEAEVVDEHLVVRVGARELQNLALVGYDVLPHELELGTHLFRETGPSTA